MKKQYLYSFAMVGLLGLNLNRFDFRMRNSTPEGVKDRGMKIEERVENKIEKFKNTVAKLEKVKVTAKDATSITVDNNGTSVKVNITSNTQLRRRFWGKSSLSEFSVNDIVNVLGKWTDDAKTTVDARVIRNESIQKRYGVFFGEVKSLTGDTFVMTTIHRDDETVTIGSAKLINRKEETINKTDILVWHKVRVRGLWDNVNKTITEVKEIKDFSLPPRPTGSPVPTPTPTP